MATPETLYPSQFQAVELNLHIHIFSSHSSPHAICMFFNHSHAICIFFNHHSYNISKCICTILSSQSIPPHVNFIIYNFITPQVVYTHKCQCPQFIITHAHIHNINIHIYKRRIYRSYTKSIPKSSFLEHI